MDARGSCLADIVFPGSNPFLKAQEKFGRMLRGPPHAGPHRPVFWQYASEGDATFDILISQIRIEVLKMSGQLWHYFEIEFDCWPFRLLQMVDARHGISALAVANAFFRDPMCNKDETFSQKLSAMFGTAQEMAHPTAI